MDSRQLKKAKDYVLWMSYIKLERMHDGPNLRKYVGIINTARSLTEQYRNERAENRLISINPSYELTLPPIKEEIGDGADVEELAEL